MHDLYLLSVFLLCHIFIVTFTRLSWKYLKRSTDIVDIFLLALVYVLFFLISFLAVIASLSVNAVSHVHLEQGILSASEASAMISMADTEAMRRGGWATTRHKWYPTTDLDCYSTIMVSLLSNNLDL